MDIFLQFPEILDEDRKVIESFKSILSNPKVKQFKFYYSSNNLSQFKNLNESLTYLTSDIKIIRQFLSSRQARDVGDKSSETIYVRWNLDCFCAYPCEETLGQISEHLYNNSSYEYMLINFEDAIESCRNQILIFRDCKHLGFPDNFVKIDFVLNGIEFNEWIVTRTRPFSIRNNHTFQKKPEIIVKGATVYYQFEKNIYWHIDTFHDYVEYEVYDNTGKHIGTADENGNITYSPKPGRSITL